MRNTAVTDDIRREGRPNMAAAGDLGERTGRTQRQPVTSERGTAEHLSGRCYPKTGPPGSFRKSV
ncbi:MAG: hypothetical protein LIV11_00380 [Bacillota bacterium]|nr:hypothetical protein [Bacillota bacterium]